MFVPLPFLPNVAGRLGARGPDAGAEGLHGHRRGRGGWARAGGHRGKGAAGARGMGPGGGAFYEGLTK